MPAQLIGVPNASRGLRGDDELKSGRSSLPDGADESGVRKWFILPEITSRENIGGSDILVYIPPGAIFIS